MAVSLGLQQRSLGAQVLRELARQPDVPGPEALREVRRDDRAALGWHRRLLQAREQGSPRLRRGIELSNKISVIQRRAYGLRDTEYLRLKVLTTVLPQI
jgi:ribosomal protein S18 acetylase RimI-like enzyme